MLFSVHEDFILPSQRVLQWNTFVQIHIPSMFCGLCKEKYLLSVNRPLLWKLGFFTYSSSRIWQIRQQFRIVRIFTLKCFHSPLNVLPQEELIVLLMGSVYILCRTSALQHFSDDHVLLKYILNSSHCDKVRVITGSKKIHLVSHTIGVWSWHFLSFRVSCKILYNICFLSNG